MLKLLLNANLSPETARFLRQEFHFDVRCLLEDGLGQITDEEVVELAKKEERIVITFDLDFGQIYHFREPEKLGVLVLRLRDQTVESVNHRLKEFFSCFEDLEKLSRDLMVVGDSHYRFYSGGDSL